MFIFGVCYNAAGCWYGRRIGYRCMVLLAKVLVVVVGDLYVDVWCWLQCCRLLLLLRICELTVYGIAYFKNLDSYKTFYKILTLREL